MTIEKSGITNIGGTVKCEDCCPCESLAPRIECLQAQIGQLTEMNGNLSLAMKTLLAVPMVKNFLPEEELDTITRKVER